MIAKEVTGLRKGQIIQFSTLGTCQRKASGIQADSAGGCGRSHCRPDLSDGDDEFKHLPPLEKGQKFLYNMEMPRFGSDGASTKELFALTDSKR